MIFWIITGIIILIWLGGIVFWAQEEGFWYAVGWFFGGLAVGAVIWLIIALILYGILNLFPATASNDYRSDLRSLSDNSSVEGHSYFLGGGFVDGKRVIDFVIDEGDYATLGRVDAEQSRIYEDEQENPYFIHTQQTTEAWWLIQTGPVAVSDSYAFHIPADSILGNYSIDNGDN